MRTILFRFFLLSWYAACAPILLAGLIGRRFNRASILLIARGIVFLLRFVAGIRIETRGKIVPGAIVASKHMSTLEIAVLALACPGDFFFIIKRVLAWIPIYGWAFWRMGFIPVNRTRGATDMRTLGARAAAEIKKGRTLIIFPEGTRVRAGSDIELRRGLSFIAAEAKAPIQPVGTDSGLYWPKYGRMRPGFAHVWIEKPMPFDTPLAEIASAIARHSA